MKRLLIIIALAIPTVQYAENFPAPLWYNISERILTETQQLFAAEAPAPKTKAKTGKIKINPLKCQPKTGNIPSIVPIPKPPVDKLDPALGMEAAARPM